ncbi:hypothetical protein IWQ60_002943 [Tieghemiomyces parasiticus]|uniref:Uncharacterized protein n=1 Tax=Tieghemiomyces parasiticus TaxID=78921 RepID=A0A9W8DV94_9FUNG|nr:hypothetical protein IWQ60_002943 [Tieghemiomyces parasiticus]
MSISSEEVNYLVLRYLRESGFKHAAFSFQYESQLDQDAFQDQPVKPGALLSVLQRGLQYLSLEAHLNDDGTVRPCSAEFRLLGDHVCEAGPVKKRNGRQGSDGRVPSPIPSVPVRSRREEARREPNDGKRTSGEPTTPTEPAPTSMAVDSRRSASPQLTERDLAKMQLDDPDEKPAPAVPPPERRVVLRGHSDKVCTCAWHPHDPRLLATGSYDATARIWTVDAGEVAMESLRLDHQLAADQENPYVTTVAWDPTGDLLATGAFDGQVRLWTRAGELRSVLQHHGAPILTLKWNPAGDLLVSTSVDATAAVWVAKTGELRRVYTAPRGPVLDAAWLTNDMLAVGSADAQVYLLSITRNDPLATFSGHEGGVNSLRADPRGQYLASGSDDRTVRIWSVETRSVVHTLTGHTGEVYALEWAPGAATGEADTLPLLATCSVDHTVRLWDARQGTCLFVLERHTEPVFALSFSPDGHRLATGTLDRHVYFWDCTSGRLVHSVECPSSIFELQWGQAGGRLACCLADHTAQVLPGPPS